MLPHTSAFGGEVKFAATDLSCLEDDGTFEGYASVFGEEDLGHDVLMPGAFKNTLRRIGLQNIRMLFQHDPNQPIGVWEVVREDARGLYVKGRLTLAVKRAREVYALMKEGGLNGLSIGFKAVRGKRDPRTGLRALYEVDLWEISIVTFPMLPQAQVASIKAKPMSASLPTTREFERWLLRDAGLSRKQARTVIASGYRKLVAGRDAATAVDPGRKGLVETLRSASLKVRLAQKSISQKER